MIKSGVIAAQISLMEMGGSNLFVKGVAEQIFMDPATGNIVGYDRTATNASVVTQINLQEIVGGMGNQLVGVLPDTARINGTYESAAFSMETREKIMGGQIAYDAVASVCERIVADAAAELTVSRTPAPFYGESSIPNLTSPIYQTISNTSVAMFNTSEPAPIDALTVDEGPVQDGFGQPTPTNIRAISARTNTTIKQCGKNLAELNNATNQDAIKFIYYLENSGDIDCEKNSAAGFFAKYMFPAVNGVKYTFKYDSYTSSKDGTNYNYPPIVYIYRDTLWGIRLDSFPFPRNGSVEWTASETGVLVLGLYSNASTPIGAAMSLRGLRIEMNVGEDEGYEPYNVNIYNVSFPSSAGVVYGGVLDLKAGKMKTDRVYLSLDGSENWQSAGVATAANNYFVLMLGASGDVVDGSGVCSHFADAQIDDTTSGIGQSVINTSSFGGGAALFIRPANVASMASVNDFKSWLAAQATANTPVQVVYKLTNPTAEYAIAPVSVIPLQGFNNIWTDGGTVQTLRYLSGWETIEVDGNVFRAYVREADAATVTGNAYGVDAKTRKVIGFSAEEGKAYDVTYYTHNASASMLPIPTMWNPVVMTIQVKYGVYAKQGVGDSASQGVLKGWLYFIVPRAILTADAGVNASQTETATTDGSWMALTNKPENLPMCADCDGSSSPMAYYVFAPCGDANEAVMDIVSVGGGMALSVGQSKKLPIKLLMPDDTLVQPDFATLNYDSDDINVAAVSNNGDVVGVGAGTTYVNTYFTRQDGTMISCATMVVVS